MQVKTITLTTATAEIVVGLLNEEFAAILRNHREGSDRDTLLAAVATASVAIQTAPERRI